MFKSNDFIQFVDVETTGFDAYGNSIIELAVVVADAKTKQICDKWVGRAQPESKSKWSMGAEKIHGISYEEAMGFPSQRACAIDYLKFMKKFKHEDDLPMDFYYHGKGKFDWRFLNAMMDKQDLLFSFRKISSNDFVKSTIDLAKNKLSLPSYKLNLVSKQLDISLNHHEAESDALACYEIWNRLSEDFNG